MIQKWLTINPNSNMSVFDDLNRRLIELKQKWVISTNININEMATEFDLDVDYTNNRISHSGTNAGKKTSTGTYAQMEIEASLHTTCSKSCQDWYPRLPSTFVVDLRLFQDHDCV